MQIVREWIYKSFKVINRSRIGSLFAKKKRGFPEKYDKKFKKYFSHRFWWKLLKNRLRYSAPESDHYSKRNILRGGHAVPLMHFEFCKGPPEKFYKKPKKIFFWVLLKIERFIIRKGIAFAGGHIVPLMHFPNFHKKCFKKFYNKIFTDNLTKNYTYLYIHI